MHKYLHILKSAVWRLFEAFENDEPYKLDIRSISRKYIEEYGEDNIEEFCAAYTYEHHSKLNILDNRASKEKMYNELYSFMKGLQEKGIVK